MFNPFKKVKNIISEYKRDSHTITLECGIVITEKSGKISLDVPPECKGIAITRIRKSLAVVIDSLRIETEDKMKIIILCESLVMAHEKQRE